MGNALLGHLTNGADQLGSDILPVMAGPDLGGLVNARLLVWAREMARLDVEAAARRAGTTAVRLQEWESGTKTPTLTQLRNLANAYKRSVGVFFLREVPLDGAPRPVDFRRIELSTRNDMSPQLVVSLREALSKRDAALDIYKELEEDAPRFDLRIAPEMSAEDAARFLADHLGITIEMRRVWSSDYAALAGWRASIEALGVLVIQVSGVSITEMRGASIFEATLPIILLNSSDSPLGRLFTLVHELTHLARTESALCDEIEDAPRAEANQLIEAYCNQVAGALLVPADALLGHPLVLGADPAYEWNASQLGSLRRFFWASREVVLRRLLIHQRTSRAHYRAMRAQFEAEYEALRNRQEGFVPPPRKVVLGNGRFLTRLVLDAYAASAITGTELARILGTKLDHLPGINDIIRRERVTL